MAEQTEVSLTVRPATAAAVADRPKAGGHSPQVDAANRPSEIQLLSMDMPRYGFVPLAALLGIAADFHRLH